MNKNIIGLLVSIGCLYTTHVESCDSGLKERFMQHPELYVQFRSEAELLKDIRFSFYCNLPKVGLKLARNLTEKNLALGQYYQYRFEQLNNSQVKDSQLFLLMQSAENGYARAMFELAEYYDLKGEENKSKDWLIEASERFNRKALEKITSDVVYFNSLKPNQRDRFVIYNYFLKRNFIFEQKRDDRQINAVISRMEVQEYHKIVNSILKQGNVVLLREEIETEAPSEPWDY